MTLKSIRKLPVFMTKSISEAGANNYLTECLKRFYNGDYGKICEEDTAANNADLAAGCGHILARYEQEGALESDLYIEACFDINEPELIDANYIMIMYPSER